MACMFCQIKKIAPTYFIPLSEMLFLPFDRNVFSCCDFCKISLKKHCIPDDMFKIRWSLEHSFHHFNVLNLGVVRGIAFAVSIANVGVDAAKLGNALHSG